MADFGYEKETKARKTHKCELCRKTIEKGEVYLKRAGVWEGDFYSVKEHKKCNELLHEYLSEVGYGEYSIDCFRDWLYESRCYNCLHNINSDCSAEKEPIDCGLWESEVE